MGYNIFALIIITIIIIYIKLLTIQFFWHLLKNITFNSVSKGDLNVKTWERIMHHF